MFDGLVIVCYCVVGVVDFDVVVWFFEVGDEVCFVVDWVV